MATDVRICELYLWEFNGDAYDFMPYIEKRMWQLTIMPRKSRIDELGALAPSDHKGNRTQKKIQSDDDRRNSITQLSKLIPESKIDYYAWAFLSNHGHFLLKIGSATLSVFMSQLLTGYAGWLNKKHRRHGQLCQNRYQSRLCQQYIYLKELVCYIHLNPLQAGIVLGLYV